MPPPTNIAVSPDVASSTGKPFPSGLVHRLHHPACFCDKKCCPLSLCTIYHCHFVFFSLSIDAMEIGLLKSGSYESAHSNVDKLARGIHFPDKVSSQCHFKNRFGQFAVADDFHSHS